MIKAKLVSLIGGIILLASCGDDPMPKPHAYPRIDIGERSYELFSPECAFEFKYSTAAKIVQGKQANCFYDLSYPQYNAKIHLTYIDIKDDLKQLIDQEYKIKEKHNQFATSVQERLYRNNEKRVNALLFNINGIKAATPLQFFITDSTQHFFRGVLYFYNTPNNDSLAPVISHIKADVDTLIESFRWKN